MTPICPETGITIPECSCPGCIEDLLNHHAPYLLRIGTSHGFAWLYL